jgi:hypothetical protein
LIHISIEGCAVEEVEALVVGEERIGAMVE